MSFNPNLYRLGITDTDKPHYKSKAFIASQRKQRTVGRKINKLRQEDVHDKGNSLDAIYSLSLAELSGLLKGKRKFNEYGELVTV